MTTTTIISTLEVMSPNGIQEDPMCVRMQPSMVSHSAPGTPAEHRQAREAEAPGGLLALAMSSGKPLNNNYYRNGFGTLLSSCFRPVLGMFGRSTTDLRRPIDDDWEIPFENIESLTWFGAGSQGAVFRGVINGKTVAVKKVNTIDDTEIKHLRPLSHPNIIEFFGVCRVAPCFAIVMEFCPKGQLGSVLKSEREIGSELWIKWAMQTAQGMLYLHKNNVIHRDLKSPNILLTEEENIKICDFGTSHEQKDRASVKMSFCGTVGWMAPEIIKKEPCSEKVDIFSYGVVLWEMIMRVVPYKNINQMAVIYGVGSSILSLEIPSSTPDGLQMLIRQCWSQKPRNRPSFHLVIQLLEVLSAELRELGEEEWTTRCAEWRHIGANLTYPETLTGFKGATEDDFAQILVQKRRDELKHVQDIKVMYENKLKRTNKMYTKLTAYMESLKFREEEVAIRERNVDQVVRGRIPSFSSNTNAQRPTVVRAGPKAIRGDNQDVCCTALPPHSNYGSQEYQEMSSSEEEAEFQRGSPIRYSQASSSSGFPSSNSACFSRQSSIRSSVGPAPVRGIRDPYSKESPVRIHSKDVFNRDVPMRHSSSSQYMGEFTRGSPARHSGMSEDSGVWNGHVWVMEGSQPTIYRNAEGRYSDGKIIQKKKTRKQWGFQRDSPARTPHTPQVRNKALRSSYPSRMDIVEDCNCGKDNCCSRRQRARSMFQERVQSPLSYESPSELSVTNLPNSSSYQEALRLADVQPPPEQYAVRQNSPVHVVGYINPIYATPIHTYTNPLHNKMESPVVEKKFDCRLLHVADPTDLYSSMDSNNPQTQRSRQSDASAESSGDEEIENNGNILDSSLDSDRAASTFNKLNKNSSEEEEEANMRRKRELMMMNSTSTMDTSLERSLELGAIYSDGLSDKEMQVRAVKNSIRGHRRTHSNPQPPIMMSIVDETSTESDCDAVDI